MSTFEGKILFVDDDKDLCEVVKDVLSEAQYNITCVSCPAHALELIKHEEFSIVFTDLVMENMNGQDLCKSIAQYKPNIPVIIITGYGSIEAAYNAIQAGAHDFLTKPFALEDLIQSIESIDYKENKN